jgi:hypothetical protein
MVDAAAGKILISPSCVIDNPLALFTFTTPAVLADA